MDIGVNTGRAARVQTRHNAPSLGAGAGNLQSAKKKSPANRPGSFIWMVRLDQYLATIGAAPQLK